MAVQRGRSRSATRRIMSVTFADAGEAVSRQFRGESSHFHPPARACRDSSFPVAVR